ncbi:hypothetical protein KIH39_12310 [Telmatocola sphagniphila]|uniref:Uncharacterized protein n=1 Tax=Telmatocola sphagniphila TaxID=1123043 RepID=A0A8E6BB29_9BACT|nr:hypothetical protein [Telmatocola sphagniphila]QVL34652.1 hypothetical protein KIH39_12310 [Telmatocola sphagniphila]
MVPNRWKTLAFCLSFSVAGLTVCAQEPGTLLHKPKKNSSTEPPAELPELLSGSEPAKNLPAVPEPGTEPTKPQVKEFVLEVPNAPLDTPKATPIELAIPDITKFDIDPPPAAPLKLAEATLPPLSIPEKSLPKPEEKTTPLIPPPIKGIDEPQNKGLDLPETPKPKPTEFDIPKPPLDSPKNSSVPNADLPPIVPLEAKPAAEKKPDPIQVPLTPAPKPAPVEAPNTEFKLEPKFELAPLPTPAPVKTPMVIERPIDVQPPKPQRVETEVPPRSISTIKPTNIPAREGEKSNSLPDKNPIRKAEATSRMKLIVTLGDGKPRFEIRNISTNKCLMKVTADAINIDQIESYIKIDNHGNRGPAPEILQKLTAHGEIHFQGPDIQGSCKELSILAGTGEVLLKGGVELRTKTAKSWSSMQSDKVVYQIGNQDNIASTQERKSVQVDTLLDESSNR